jgi:hypothetical protein
MAERPGLTGIYIGSGISVKTREPFCHVTVQATDGTFCEGQLDPVTVRRMAFDWLEAAEAAIHDAAVFHMLLAKGADEGIASGMVAAIRDFRQDAGRMTDAPEDEPAGDG